MKLALFSIGSILLPLVASLPVVDVNIHITDDVHVRGPMRMPHSQSLNREQGKSHSLQHVLEQNSIKTAQEKIPGWLYVEGKMLRARIHGNTFWNIKGTLDESFPLEDFLFDPLVFALNDPYDYEGSFNGTVGKGEIKLQWPKSGATMSGRSSVGDYVVSGKSEVAFGP